MTAAWRRVTAMAAAVAVVAAAGVVAGAAPAAADPPAPLCADRDPIAAGLAGELARRYPGQRFSAAVVDSATGCSYHLNPSLRMTTASVVKLEVLAGVVLRAQREGRALTSWERERLWPMITESANPPTSELWSSLGGMAGMEALDGDFGLTDTVHGSTTWGLTSTSAFDQARLIRQVVSDGGPLTPASRAEARYYLTNVVPEQRWGASAGVPSGWVVAQKNGFAPSQCCRWRLNTAGWVERPDGTGWAVVVLSDGWPTEAQGVAAVDELAGRINRTMADRPWSGPGIGTAGSGLDIAARHRVSGSLLHGELSSAPSIPWRDAGGSITSDPDVAASVNAGTSELVARGLDGAVWVSSSTGSGPAWATLGGVCTSGPAVARSGPDRLDVYCRGVDGGLWSRTRMNSAGWGPWHLLGGSITSSPDAAGRPDGSPPQVVARGLDGAVWQYLWIDGAWRHGSLGGVCTSGPTIASSVPSRADVFCRGQDDQLWSRWWTTATGWGPWHRVGGLLRGDPDAATPTGAAVPDVVGVGNDLRLWRYRWTGNIWQLAPMN